MQDKSYAKKVALYGMLIALAMIMSYIESLIPIYLGAPGVKLGLANLVTIICLYMIGVRGAVIVSLIRIVLVGFTFGSVFSMTYALSGGALSMLCMILARKSGKLSTAGVSIVGGMTHNIGQLLVAAWVIRDARVMFYLPILMMTGIVSGLIIGVLAATIIKRIRGVIDDDKSINI